MIGGAYAGILPPCKRDTGSKRYKANFSEISHKADFVENTVLRAQKIVGD